MRSASSSRLGVFPGGMRAPRVALLIGAIIASGCSSKDEGTAPRSTAARPAVSSVASTPTRAALPHVAPSGTLAGAPFAPTVAMMLRDSDGVQLGFYQLHKNRERWLCEEPLGDTASKLEVRSAVDWVLGVAVETPLSQWSVGDGSKPATDGTVSVTVAKRDEKTFTMSGTLEVKSADGSSAFRGPFEGEYCPTKLVERAPPTSTGGVDWTDQPFAADRIPSTPITSALAGAPAAIHEVVIRTVRGRTGLEEELVFYRDKLADPCMPREDGGWLTSYGPSGAIASRKGAKVRADYFVVYLAKPPTKGDTPTGLVSSAMKRDLAAGVRSASLHVFEPDGYRSFIYDQYFSATLSFDDVSDAHAAGRIYLALPDKGRSMLVGAFDARRCPPSKD